MPQRTGRFGGAAVAFREVADAPFGPSGTPVSFVSFLMARTSPGEDECWHIPERVRVARSMVWYALIGECAL